MTSQYQYRLVNKTNFDFAQSDSHPERIRRVLEKLSFKSLLLLNDYEFRILIVE